jgi:acetone carboxylase gamma subunit
MRGIKMASKCDCGHAFAESDIGIVESAPANYYPYEGDVVTFVCPVCGYLTDLKESEVKL